MGAMQMCAKQPMLKASHWDAWHRALFYDEHTGKSCDLSSYHLKEKFAGTCSWVSE